jgi:hypothetical protein
LFRPEWGLYALGLVFYILFLRAADRMEAESQLVAHEEDLYWPRWLALWRLHRRSFQESSLRWQLPLRLAMIFVFMAGGTVLAMIRHSRGY